MQIHLKMCGIPNGSLACSPGKHLDRAALDDLLAFAEQQAGSFHTNLHLLWSGLNSPLLRVQAAD